MLNTGQLTIRSICGSLRKGSFNAAVQRALPDLAPATMRIEPLGGVGDLPLYNGDVEAAGFPDEVVALGEAIRAADGLIVCTPEYNNSVPGVLKNVGSSRVDLQACKLEYSIVSPK